MQDIESWIDFTNKNNLEILQRKLKDNMDKAVELANKNTIRNEQGHVIIYKDDEWLNDTEYDEEELKDELL